MKYSLTNLDLHLIEPTVFGDNRGYFFESFNAERYRNAGLFAIFVQDNISSSRQGVLRGLHFQSPNPQGKLVSVLEGEVFDVAVDIRIGSSTFGKWYGVVLDGISKKQLYIPEGFAHGFVVLSESAIFIYKCTAYYSPESEHTLMWNDPSIGIEWPIKDPQLSQKDSDGLTLDDLKSKEMLPFHSDTPR